MTSVTPTTLEAFFKGDPQLCGRYIPRSVRVVRYRNHRIDFCSVKCVACTAVIESKAAGGLVEALRNHVETHDLVSTLPSLHDS